MHEALSCNIHLTEKRFAQNVYTPTILQNKGDFSFSGLESGLYSKDWKGIDPGFVSCTAHFQILNNFYSNSNNPSFVSSILLA